MNSEIKISVRNLIEFVMSSGDLDSRFIGTARALEGTKAHQKIQKSYKENYQAEVNLSYTIEYKAFSITVEGRADGIIKSEEGYCIDEIKTVTKPLLLVDEDYSELHWAQAKSYAYIYAIQNQLSSIWVQLTYYHINTEEIKYITKYFDTNELEAFFYKLIEDYFLWADLTREWNEKRDASIKAMTFPYNSYRKGQRELAVGVYKTIKEGKKLFIQAPTGIGKTLATLFPTVKALGEGNISKIFYLTAKAITRNIAEKAFDNMRQKGLRFKTVTITAKDKICFKPEVSSCNPEECEYARGYFDRVKTAIQDVFIEDSFTRSVIEEYARKHKVCPFEFSLDLTNFADCTICDYNYVFDPRVYLRRYFQESAGDYCFLIDEAHNLVDRAREMYSAEILKKTVLKLKNDTKSKCNNISKNLNKINTYMISLRKRLEENKINFLIDKEVPKDILKILRSFMKVSEEWLVKDEKADFKDELMEFYFKVSSFIRTSEIYDDKYITYIEKIDDEIRLKMFCLDPSKLLKEAMKKGKVAIMFSATLTPMEYFMYILGGEEDSFKMKLASPFPKENLCLMVDGRFSTKYNYREKTYESITKDISVVVNSNKGNYLVFFPSYKYMREIFQRFIELNPNLDCTCQESGMSEEEREEFLQRFSEDNKKTMIGFAVLGGVFGEGIDLTGDKLIGAVIVGVGLPQICVERDIIKKYFQQFNNRGFEYAYVYPGINKVMQAVGRVIRTEFDRGVVLMIDDRFNEESYKKLFPREWDHIRKINNYGELEGIIKNFWME